MIRSLFAVTLCFLLLSLCCGEEVRVTGRTGGKCAVSLSPENALLLDKDTDWSIYQSMSLPRKYCISVFDGHGKKAAGYIGEQGAAEELGAEFLTNGGMENWKRDILMWALSRGKVSDETIILRPGTSGDHSVKCTITNGENPYGASNANMDQTLSVENAILYKMTTWMRNGNAESVYAKMQNTDTGNSVATPPYFSTDWEEITAYFVPYRSSLHEIWIYFFVTGEDGKYGYVDDMSFKEVIVPGKNVVKIYQERDSSNRGWETIDAGFDPYKISHYVIGE